MSQILAVISSALYGAADFAGGVATKTVSSWRVVAWSQIFGVALLIVTLPLIGYESVPAADLGWGALAGVAGVVGVYALYRALAEGTMSIVSPATASLTALLPLIVGPDAGPDKGPEDPHEAEDAEIAEEPAGKTPGADPKGDEKLVSQGQD